MAGMGVECKHSAGLLSTPSPTRLADRAKPKAWPSGRRVGSTGPKHVRPQPMPGEGGPNIGYAEFGRQTTFHNAKRLFLKSRPINRMRPVHPGEVLREDYLAPLGMSVNFLTVAHQS